MNAIWYWLSFCDANLPKGSQFLGACLVEGEDLPTAVENAHKRKINPGGEVMGVKCDPMTTVLVPEKWKNRLLTRQEAEEMDEEVLALQNKSGVTIPQEPEQEFICEIHNNKPVGKA